MPIEDAVVEPIVEQPKQPTQEEINEMIKNIKYKPQALVWHNFNLEQPVVDRWIYLWCPFGKLHQNIFVTHRDLTGNYDLPHPTKRFPAYAWAYADNPEVEQPEVTVQ
jgi:hypothetical protein